LLQVRAEAFSLPNVVNLATPATSTTNSLSSPDFGQITTDISGNNGLTSGDDPRIVQLAMKFVFWGHHYLQRRLEAFNRNAGAGACGLRAASRYEPRPLSGARR
jgi:hypothetical protein